jgi:hypothetical protein
MAYLPSEADRDQLLGRMLDLHNHPLNARQLHWIVSIPTNELRCSAIDTISHFLDCRDITVDSPIDQRTRGNPPMMERHGSINPVGISASRSP